MKKEEHVHKYKRVKLKSGNIVFFCALPDCKKRNNPAFLLGKRSICWRCGDLFIMNEYSLRLSKPHCENCHRPKNDNSKEEVPIKQAESLAEKLAALAFSAESKEDEGEI